MKGVPPGGESLRQLTHRKKLLRGNCLQQRYSQQCTPGCLFHLDTQTDRGPEVTEGLPTCSAGLQLQYALVEQAETVD